MMRGPALLRAPGTNAMFVVAAVLLALTALGGATAAILHLKDRPPKAWLGRVHGAMGLLAIIVLAIGIGQAATDDWKDAAFAVGALVVLFMGAILGRLIFLYHLRKGSVPKELILMHGLAQATGLVLVLVEIAKGP